MIAGKGIDNYGLYPMGMSPLDTLQWARENGAEGVAFSGIDNSHRHLITKDYLQKIRSFASDNNLYLEWGGGQHIPRDMQSWEQKNIFDNNKRMAVEANALGTNIIRSCSGGLMRWNPENPATGDLMDEMAEELSNQLNMLRENQVVLAIETHFEFTSFELLRVFEMIGIKPGDCLGICLDTMNLMTMLEDPLPAVIRLLPWVVSTHIKDGGVIMKEEGLQTFTTPVGDGIVELGKIIELLSKLPQKINLNIEDHGGSFDLPVFEPLFLQEFTDLSTEEFVSILELAGKTSGLIGKGKIRPLAREDWPGVCEERLKKDLIALKKMTDGKP